MVAVSTLMPAVLGRYQVEAVIGRGSSGRVLRVRDAKGELRALKLVPGGAYEALLFAEFEQLARLRHPALPRVYEVGRTTEAVEELAAGAPYFVAEWIAGPRCDAVAWEGDLGARLWALLADVAGALATIHAAGLVHGDVAPQNILVGDDRAVLVDLGLAMATGARGTPAYMAPEALAGVVEPRSDLYGLGATIVRLVTGRPLVEARGLGELAQRILAGVPAPHLPGVPAPLADLIGRLVARDLDARPASALAVLDELDQVAAAIGIHGPRRARPRVGPPPAPATWTGADAIVDGLLHALAGAHAAVVLTAAPGAGGRELTARARQRWQLAQVARQRPAGALTGSLDDIAAMLAVEATSARGWLERVARAVRRAGELVTLELHDDPRAPEVIAALLRAPGDRPVLVVTEHAPAARPGLALLAAPVLDVEGVGVLAARMLGAAPPRPWVAGLHAASGGLPRHVIELVRGIAGEKEPFAIDWSARTSRGAAELRRVQLQALGPAPLRLAAALAAFGGEARVEHVLGALRAEGAKLVVGLAEVAELERAGLVRRRADRVAIDRATCDALEAQVGAPAIAAHAGAALDVMAGAPAALLAPLLERAPLDAGRAVLACEVAERLLARGRGDRAGVLARRALTLLPARAGLIAARAAAALGAYRDVRALAEAAARAGADPAEAQLVIARAAQRAGDLDAAETTLAQLHAAHPAHAEAAGAYARLLVTRSRYAVARDIARAGGALTGLRAEAAGLAAFYLGDLDEADGAFAALELEASAREDAATAGRAASLRGMVAQQRGQLGLASERYREAARRLGEVGELHAAAVAELNLGTVLAERGRASEALPRLVAAGRVFADLGAITELCAAELNRGNALLAVGQIDEARAAAETALARAEGAPHLRAFALLVLGDARRRLGDERGAQRSYREALAIGAERDDAHAQLSAHVALAEAGCRDGDGVDVEQLCASADDRDRWSLARARLALATPEVGAEVLGALAAACAAVAVRAEEADRLERALRGHALTALLAQRARAPAHAVFAAAERARAAHATLLAAAAPAFRAMIAADPDLALLPGAVPTAAAARGEPRAEGGHVRRLLTLSRRLNSEASLARILDDVIDTAIELTLAERGFLLLRQPSGELQPVVSRNFESGDLEPAPRDPRDGRSGPASVSRSIAERAAQTGEPVVTVDAGIDERFGAAASVAALRLRSVLTVPLRQRGVITGCIYVDHRLRGGAFDDGAASLLGELADIAAIAIENARLAADLRTSARAVDELNQRLSAELAERDAELVRVKADLPDRDRLGHGYEAIVGRSPAMLRMLAVLERAAATSLPVVIVGESGTGKELVARALHDHGPRKAGPFVAINCSAVPEALLESELFGHVRGAFTGAERDRRGLFEVADGGTLFLDEVADTSVAMQAKLLRVLQDGMIRRVGDTATRKVDVRVVAASQHPLAELASAGRFREDLRFRLEVIGVPVPPLREREGDIPVLVDGLLARLCAGRPVPRLTRAALRALTQHRWPGNVRELENALARGMAMGGEVIDVVDLPEAIAAQAARPEPAKPVLGEDLRLKPALLATEHAYIGAAMTRAKGNQTVAARLLGLSRFGLQKKLRRLAGEDVDEPDERGDA